MIKFGHKCNNLVKIQVAVSEGHQIRPLESLPLATWTLRTKTSHVLSGKELLEVVFRSSTIISAYVPDSMNIDNNGYCS